MKMSERLKQEAATMGPHWAASFIRGIEYAADFVAAHEQTKATQERSPAVKTFKTTACFEAYKQGAVARKKGVVVGNNPYPEMAEEFWPWMSGWRDGVSPQKEDV